MKQLQLLCRSIGIGVLAGAVWAVVGLIFGPTEAWVAAGGAAGATYWTFQGDHS